jgi:histidine triad (HIT) family protein
LSSSSNCTFCKITAYEEPAKVWYVDNDIMVIKNRLNWVPVMLLLMPKEHLSQYEMWSSGLMPKLGDIAVELGLTFAPNGFRILSNFGRDGMQSQSHGHLHVIGGVQLQEYA